MDTKIVLILLVIKILLSDGEIVCSIGYKKFDTPSLCPLYNLTSCQEINTKMRPALSCLSDFKMIYICPTFYDCYPKKIDQLLTKAAVTVKIVNNDYSVSPLIIGLSVVGCIAFILMIIGSYCIYRKRHNLTRRRSRLVNVSYISDSLEMQPLNSSHHPSTRPVPSFSPTHPSFNSSSINSPTISQSIELDVVTSRRIESTSSPETEVSHAYDKYTRDQIINIFDK